jgi:hypothetical protein
VSHKFHSDPSNQPDSFPLANWKGKKTIFIFKKQKRAHLWVFFGGDVWDVWRTGGHEIDRHSCFIILKFIPLAEKPDFRVM